MRCGWSLSNKSTVKTANNRLRLGNLKRYDVARLPIALVGGIIQLAISH